jgi:hypothetical protein
LNLKNRIEKLEGKAQPEKRGKNYIVVNEHLKNVGERIEAGESWNENDYLYIVSSKEEADSLKEGLIRGFDVIREENIRILNSKDEELTEEDLKKKKILEEEIRKMEKKQKADLAEFCNMKKIN